MAEKASGGVQSVERVFELLELITDAGGDVTLSELSSSTDLPLPTIHRLLRTLVSLGYIRQLPNRRYALGPRLIRLGEGANKQLGALARPQLKSLVDRLGETSNMAVLDSDMVIYVAQVPSLHSMRMFTEVGRRAHTHDPRRQGHPGPARRRSGPRHRGPHRHADSHGQDIGDVDSLSPTSDP